MKRFAELVAGIACISVLILNSCASAPPLVPITNPDQRMQFNGFSVLPPSGTGWSWVGREGQDQSKLVRTTFGKGEGERSYIAVVELMDTEGRQFSNQEELLSFVKDAKIMQEGPRQANMKSSFAHDQTLGHPCIRYDFEAQDTRVPGRAGIVFNIDGHGLVCVHPETTGVIAWIAYTRRAPQGFPYVGGKEEGERFLKSVQFAEVQKPR